MDAVSRIKHSRAGLMPLLRPDHPTASRRRVVAGFAGPVLLGLGAGVSVSAGFGSFGFSVLLDGLDHSFEQPLWRSQLLITLLCYLLAWLWAGVPLGIGTIPALLLIGPAISFGATTTPETAVFGLNLLAFVTGLVLFALGISLAAAARLGPDGITALSLAAEKRHRWPVAQATLLWNAVAIAAGIVLGGNFGVATILGLLLVPLMIHRMLPFLRARLD